MASNKFHTTLKQHENAKRRHKHSGKKLTTTGIQHAERKALYNMRWGWPHKSAVDPQWWVERQAKDPYLYHKTETGPAQSILNEGLYPYDENETGTDYTDELVPRPGHVYLARHHKLDAVAGGKGTTLRIDTRMLDPQRLTADEDAYAFGDDLTSTAQHNPPRAFWSNAMKRVLPEEICGRYQNLNPYTHPQWTQVARQELAESGEQTWPHYGAWANDVLNHPEHTQISYDKHGTVAYQGHIPPEAITVENPGNLDTADNPEWYDRSLQTVSAADPDWLNAYMERNGPYLYHGTDPEVVDKIAQEGLYPHDHGNDLESQGVCQSCGMNGFNPDDPICYGCGAVNVQPAPPSRSQWAGQYLEPRSGHVYMGTYNKANIYTKTPYAPMLRIDMRKLDPTRMNADEDHFAQGNIHSNQWWDVPAVRNIWDNDPPPGPYDGEESLGRWADDLNLGNDPEETHHSLGNGGSIAYKGIVPPEAIEVDRVPRGVGSHPRADTGWKAPDLSLEQTFAKTAADQSDVDNRVIQDPNELHIGMDIPLHACKAIFRWARDQQWPEGTELEQPGDYHITLLYTPEGHDEHENAWWIKHLEHAHAKISGIDSFSAQDKGFAIVLRLDSPEIEEHAVNLQARAEQMGLPVTHFPGGYKPHITIAYSPAKANIKDFPPLAIDVGPSSVSPPRKASAAPEPPNLREGSPSKQCGNCLMFTGRKCWGYGDWPVDKNDVCDSWSKETHAAYSPDETKALDQLSLSSVAHNLHYRFEQGTDSSDIVTYAQRLLKMIGYQPDQLTTQAAIQSWQQMYPQDVLNDYDISPESASQISAATYPPPGGTHQCPQCGHGMIPNGWRGWTGVDPEGANVAPYGWSCPSCGSDLKPVEGRPVRLARTNQLYHWLEAHELDNWMDPAHTGPGHTYLTETGDDPNMEWNDDIPRFHHPVRLTVDANQLDPELFDKGYSGWLGNHLYNGVIPPSAVADVKSFKRPEGWDNTNVEPSPDDNWPEFGDLPPDEHQHRDVQFSNDFR